MIRSICFALCIGFTSGQASNPACSASQTIPSLPFDTVGDVSLSSFVEHTQAESCALLSSLSFQDNENAPTIHRGLWYVYTASSDGCITATASDSDGDNSFDPALFVYTGACSELSCEAMNDNLSLGNVDSQVNFNAVAGTTYYIFVTGSEFGSSSLEFDFSIAQISETCSVATGSQFCPVCLNGGQPAAGATLDGESLCQDIPEDISSVDEGGRCLPLQITAGPICGCPVDNTQATCKLCPGGEDVPDPTLPIPMATFTTCGSVNSFAGGDLCGNDSTLGLAALCGCPGTTPCRLCGESSMTYNASFTLEFGFGFSLLCGDIDMQLQFANAFFPITDKCSPESLDLLYGANVVGACCNGEDLLFSFPTPEPFPTPAPEPTTSPQPTFSPPGPSLCPNARDVASLPNIISGSTSLFPPAQDESALSCSAVSFLRLPYRGEWFTYASTSDACVTVTMAGNFDTVLAVYTGANCDSLSCLVDNDDTDVQGAFDDEADAPGPFNFGSQVSFKTGQEVTYYILATGFFGDSGDFTLQLSENKCSDTATTEAPAAALPLSSVPTRAPANEILNVSAAVAITPTQSPTDNSGMTESPVATSVSESGCGQFSFGAGMTITFAIFFFVCG